MTKEAAGSKYLTILTPNDLRQRIAEVARRDSVTLAAATKRLISIGLRVDAGANSHG
jgi:hypothetical protein